MRPSRSERMASAIGASDAISRASSLARMLASFANVIAAAVTPQTP